MLASWGVHREDEAFTSLGPYEAAGAVGFAYWLGLPRELAGLAATAFHGLSQLHDQPRPCGAALDHGTLGEAAARGAGRMRRSGSIPPGAQPRWTARMAEARVRAAGHLACRCAPATRQTW